MIQKLKNRISKLNTPVLKGVCRWLSTTVLMFMALAYMMEVSGDDFGVWLGISVLYIIAMLPGDYGWGEK